MLARLPCTAYGDEPSAVRKARLLWKYVICLGLHHGPPNLEHVERR